MVKGRTVRLLEKDLQNATTYAEWREIALDIDRTNGADEWKAETDTRLYDFHSIEMRMHELRRLRRARRLDELLYVLHEGLHGNLANMANSALYTHSRIGTKNLIGEYLNEVEACLDFIVSWEDTEEFDTGEKFRFLRNIGQSFGRSALMLSGGASLGLFHIGVAKALFEEGLLPRVISGSSAGSIIASVIGCTTDEELLDALNPQSIQLEPFRMYSLKGMWRSGSMMDSRALERCLRENIGEFTFEEAFKQTGRIINLSISPANKHQQGRVLNYMNAPHVFIYSGSLASCAVPLVFKPVQLQGRDFRGRQVAYMPGRRWVDGSVRADLPKLRLSRFHNVNHYIVSQTNPHVVPFASKKVYTGGVGKLTRGLLTTTVQGLSRQMAEYARDHLSLSGVGGLIEKGTSVASQSYSGDINIYPS